MNNSLVLERDKQFTALTAQRPDGILSGGACMMLTRVGMRRICIGPWQASIWASSLKMSCAKDATTGSDKKLVKKR